MLDFCGHLWAQPRQWTKNTFSSTTDNGYVHKFFNNTDNLMQQRSLLLPNIRAGGLVRETGNTLHTYKSNFLLIEQQLCFVSGGH